MANRDYCRTPEYREKQRLVQTGTIRPQCARFGKDNGRFKGGNSYSSQSKVYLSLTKSLVQECSLCSSKEKLVTHHIDFNCKNNVLENITIVCRGCHNKIHKTGKPRNNKIGR